MAWLSALAGVDAWTVAMILVAAGFYAGALLAAGAVLFRLAFPDLPDPERRAASRTGAIAAWAAIVLAVIEWPLQAGYLGGGNGAAAVDPMLLGMVFEGAQGTQLILAVSGLLLVQAILLDARRLPGLGHGLSLGGVLLVMLAFVQVGHTVDEPRWLLGGLLVLHLLAAAFWIGSLWPLYRLAGHPAGGADAVRILDRFGRVAVFGVGLLVLAGVVLAALLLGGVTPLLTTGYGQFLIGKVLIVALLLLLAASNKWRLVPAFERGEPRAPQRLRRSIAMEIGLVGLVLLVTAILTTVSSPANG
ncbi:MULTISPECIES: copper resistance D family protein [unclassified Thioalkalivibrio]|uniref:copper resistance D family protein n=1 Tax=unclassified Thioalkalivibrio TaxID=2621013 RepID=UPI000360A9DC|nr:MULTISPECIES: CopD family protein [unclassified Thioalkalivibrio]